MNWLNALGSVPQDRVFVVWNGVWGHEGDALEIGVWWEEKVETKIHHYETPYSMRIHFFFILTN